MELYKSSREDGRVVVEPTTAGRLAGAAVRFAIWAPVAMFGLSLMFMPDYLCQYREQEPVPGMFWMVMLVGAAFIGALGAFVKFARRDVWAFDAEAQEVVFEANPLFGQSARTAADLDQWTALRAERSAMPGRSSIAVGLAEHPDERICESRFGWSPLSGVWEDLVAFVDDQRLDVELAETSSGREP